MKVAVSVMGRFHAFDLAAQLERRDQLAQLITSYPKFDVEKYGIPRARVSSVLSNELLRRAWSRLPSALTRGVDPRDFFSRHYEGRAVRRLREGADVFVGWSGSALAAIRRAREMGMLSIVERGSTHMLHQTEVLLREYAQQGLEAEVGHPDVVERELAEYEEADRISVPSSFVKRTFVARGVPESKLIQVPYGVSIDQFEPVPKDDDVFRIIHCGRVNIRKGCHLLLEAFQALSIPNAELWFVGRVADEMRPFLARAGSNVVAHGVKPQSELARYYGNSSVFCLASIEEGLAMVVPQAMACGLPVIASEESGAEDIARDGIDGYILPAHDTEALKRRILELYEDPVRRAEMGESARRRVREGFTWVDYGDRISAAYAAALAARNGAA